MDLFVRHRVPSTARGTPVLRVLETSQLLLHEHPDVARVERLVGAFRRDGVLRNPPIVTPLLPPPKGGGRTAQFVILDGANRIPALRDRGAPHVPAQVVRYDQAEHGAPPRPP